MRQGVEDVVFGYLRFPSGLAAHLHLSWLDPHKERRFTVVGSKRMATFDDMDIERKLTVYDKGFDEDARSYGEYITRSGDIWTPADPQREPLRLECEHFVECVRDGRAPALGRRERPARRARARGPAGARSTPPRRASAVQRLSSRPELGPRRGVRLGEGVDRLHVVVHPGTVIGDGCASRTTRCSASAELAPHSSAPRGARRRSSSAPASSVCAGAVVFAGARLGDGRDRRRPGLRARARAGRRGHGRRPRHARSTTTS